MTNFVNALAVADIAALHTYRRIAPASNWLAIRSSFDIVAAYLLFSVRSVATLRSRDDAERRASWIDADDYVDLLFC